jgi:hypothetical protein
MFKNVTRPLFLSDFNETWDIYLQFSKKNTQISKFMKIRPVGAGQTDGHTNMTKLTVAFT